jgi:hypothetical protein
MKPVERSGYIDIWILIQQSADGKFYYNTTSTTISPFGTGFFTSERDAQHQQTIELLKGTKCEVFHLEFPIK